MLHKCLLEDQNRYAKLKSGGSRSNGVASIKSRYPQKMKIQKVGQKTLFRKKTFLLQFHDLIVILHAKNQVSSTFYVSVITAESY